MKFVPAHAVVESEAEGAAPRRTAFVLHGILGSLKNWRSFARRIVGAWPDWRVVLVDLRNHGDSHGAPPPHTLAACAADLRALAARLGVEPELVVGHSFGGKVALVYGREYEVDSPALRGVWVLDAVPGPAPGGADRRGVHEVERVIADVRRVAVPVPSREALVERLRALGHGDAVARWMTTNLRPVPGGFAWRFDLDAVEEMLADYAREDLWPYLADPGRRASVDVVRATRSDRWTSDVLERFADLGPRVRLHTLAGAGHWLHVDDPRGLLAILAAGFGGETGIGV